MTPNLTEKNQKTRRQLWHQDERQNQTKPSHSFRKSGKKVSFLFVKGHPSRGYKKLHIGAKTILKSEFMFVCFKGGIGTGVFRSHPLPDRHVSICRDSQNREFPLHHWKHCFRNLDQSVWIDYFQPKFFI